MTRRGSTGSWLEGGPAGEPGPDGGADRLGLPEVGPGSRGGLGRRLVALSVDWLACLAVASVVAPATAEGLFLLRADPMVTLAVFAVENVVLVGTLGTTLGHRLLGMRVAPLGVVDGSWALGARAPGLLRAAGRTVLLCLVIPAVVWDGDGRGLHDRAAGTVIVRR